MLGEPFKTVVRIATVGHAGHGKSTVATSLGRAALRDSGVYPFTEPFEVANEIASSTKVEITATETTFETASRRYINADFATHGDAIKGLVASKPLQGVIIVVSAIEGVEDGTRELAALARSVGVQHAVVLLNQIDRAKDAKLLGAREAEARELLSQAGFSGPDTMVVHGSARLPRQIPDGQGMRDLVVALDIVMPEAESDHQLAFMMPVERAVVTLGGALLNGVVARGRIQPGQDLEVRGAAAGAVKRVKCHGVEIARRAVKAACPGDMCGVIVSDLAFHDLTDANLITQPSGAGRHARFVAEVYVLTHAEGGTGTEISVGHALEVLLLGAAISATVTGSVGKEDTKVAPGEHTSITISLANPITMEAGTRFTIRERGSTVGLGAVARILDLT